MYKMDTAKLHAQERLTEYKESVADAVDKLVDELKQRTDDVIVAVAHSLAHPDRLLDTFGNNVDRVFSARTVDTIKDAIETDAAFALAFKDQLVGGVKETIGHLIRDGQLAREGQRQVTKGRSEVALQQSLADEKKYQKLRAQIVTTLLRRESLLNQIAFAGGFDKMRATMRHVQVRDEVDFADLFPRDRPFALKHFDVQPLLRDIREGNTPRPMVLVVPRLRDPLRSSPSLFSSKKELASLKRVTHDSRRVDLLAAIRRSDVQKLRAVPFAKISDRSQVRLDLLHSLRKADESRPSVLRDIVGSHGRQQKQQLIHVAEIDDKASPAAFFEKNGFAGVHKQMEQLKSMEDMNEGSGLETRQNTAITHL